MGFSVWFVGLAGLVLGWVGVFKLGLTFGTSEFFLTGKTGTMFSGGGGMGKIEEFALV